MMRIAKAVFPAAGLGTRFLPATKAQPKEMLPLVDKPLIQYELEDVLEARGKTDQLNEVREISNMINVSYVRQKEALGLGHAVLVARDSMGHDPFAVMLGDDIIDSQVPCMKQ